MAEGEITVRIPGLNPPIPEVVIGCFPEGDEDYSLTPLGTLGVASISNQGATALTGALYEKMNYVVTGITTEEEALRLAALVRWSGRQYKNGNDGALEIDFEMEYLDPEPSPHSKPLVQTLPTNYGYEYGYPRLSAVISLGENYRKRIGANGGTFYSQVMFTISEL